MKLISSMIFVMTIAFGIAAWKYSIPLFTQHGNAVIYVMDTEKNGDHPLTTKLPDDLSSKQNEMLNFAFDVAKNDGIKHPQYLQGILMQESHVCDMKNFRVAGLENKVGDRYFGCGQIKMAAARAVLKQFPALWKFLETKTDEELQARLILDDRFNIRVASKYVLMMGVNQNPMKAITAYNTGLGAAQDIDQAAHPYTASVKKISAKLKSIQSGNHEIQSSKPTKIALK